MTSEELRERIARTGEEIIDLVHKNLRDEAEHIICLRLVLEAMSLAAAR